MAANSAGDARSAGELGSAAADAGRAEFVGAMADLAGSVYDFHARFGIPNINGSDAATGAAGARLLARLAILTEEVGEHAAELNRSDIRLAADEMGDAAFVAMGTLLELGELGTAAARRVADKNDKKTLATHVSEPGSGKVVRRSRGRSSGRSGGRSGE